MLSSYIRFIKNFHNYDDRETRKQFWPVVLIQLIIMIIFMMAFWIMIDRFEAAFIFTFLSFIIGYILITKPIHAAVHRRMNDVGRNTKLLKVFDTITFLVAGAVFIIGMIYLFMHIPYFERLLFPSVFLLFGLKIIFSAIYCLFPTDHFIIKK
ncbi:DUF805 domain-containing protein [Macrococcus equi]|uniref:DUF805 domain-containing protein n=1 Tax=Macrococcus equi TaxID=3395462 RepID=UPI0039BE4196